MFGFGEKPAVNKSETHSSEVRQALLAKMQEVAELHRQAGNEVSDDDVRAATSALLAEAVQNGKPYTMETVSEVDVQKFVEMLGKDQPGQPVVTGRGEFAGMTHNSVETNRVIRDSAEENREAA